jgi:hypothetical protein
VKPFIFQGGERLIKRGKTDQKNIAMTSRSKSAATTTTKIEIKKEISVNNSQLFGAGIDVETFTRKKNDYRSISFFVLRLKERE